MSKKRIQTLKTMDYNKVLADPFAYLNTLKGDQMAEDFDLDSLGKSKHSVTAANFMSSEIDIAKSIREVVDSRMRVPKDMRIDDGDLPMARNFFEWVTEDKFGLVNNEKPFIEQLCWAIIAFNEFCFYCSDLDYLYDTHEVDDTYAKFERKVSLLEHGVCPSCKKGRADWLNKGEGKFIQELNISAGQRSGKSIAVGGWYAPYLTHRMLKLQNPSAFYNLKTGTMLHCTFVALTYVQAKDTLWQYFYATLTESTWFKNYHSLLRHYENRYGERLFKFNDTYVAYPTRGIMIYPAGPDKRVLRGRTRYFTSVDEIGWFDSNKDSNKVKDNAHEVVGALDRSLLTVRGAAETLIKQGHHDVYPGYAMNVSSPSHRNDMINYLVRKSENSRSSYGAIRPTWEVNPTLPRDSAAIQAAFDEDPITAQRDYGAIPPLVSSPFLASESAIESVLVGKPNRIQIRRRISKSRKMGESYTVAKLAKVRRYRKPTIMTIDAGYSNNSFACCIGDIAEDMTTAVVRGVFEVIPAAGAPLNHAIIYQELLLPLMERFNVKVLLADRWNSIKLLQDAAIHHDLEVSAQHSLKYAQIHTVKTRVQQGSLVLPEPERGTLTDCLDFEADGYPECFEGQPASHLAMQMATVKDTGKTVDKGDGYTDDIFRAVALFCYACDVEDYQYALQDADDTEEDGQDRPTAFGVSSLLSGGGTVWGTGGSQASDGVGFMGGYLPGKQ